MNKNKVYKDLMTYIRRIRENSTGYIFDQFSINIYSLVYYSLMFTTIYLFIRFVFGNFSLIYLTLFISSLIAGLSIIKYGFKKIILIASSTAIVMFLYYIASIEIKLVPIFLIILIYPIKEFKRYSKIKQLSNFYLFEEDGIKGCNLIIKDITPLKTYENLIKIKINLDSELQLKEINEFNNKFLLYTNKKKQIFIGFKYLKFKLIYEVYLYSNEIDLDDMKHYLDKNINYSYEIKQVKDKNYKFYYEQICPSERLFMHMCNKNIIDNKLPEEIDLYEEQSLILVLAFKEKEEALKCMDELHLSNDYEKIDFDDNIKYVIDNNLNEKFNNLLYIEQKSRIGLSKINMITDKMFDIAEKYNGSFEEWGLGSLSKDED